MSLRGAIVLAAFAGVVLAAQDLKIETDAQRDLRMFYESTGDRAVWVDPRGRPTPEAWRVLTRLGGVDADGLVPDDYQARDLERQAAALEGAAVYSAVDAAAFDVGTTAAVLKYFRELHLGRVKPRDLGFHLDHGVEPHDFPDKLHAALSTRSFDRVVDDLRPPFVQYRRLREALPRFRETDPPRARQIELALERLRWLPDLAGRLLVVNIPMFRVWAWEAERADGAPALEMAAIIGRARATKTPVFVADMTSVVFNPEWIVPDSIVRNEILPEMKSDPEYLARQHMVMSGNGELPRVRQLPGPWNALGRVKFVMPNVHGVYLHDTPAPELFERERRDFSHGCVRVENPLALASWVLGPQDGWTPESIRAAIDEGVTQSVKVASPPHVVVFYMTAAFVPDEGTVRFADDIYGHDARLDAWLQARAGGNTP